MTLALGALVSTAVAGPGREPTVAERAAELATYRTAVEAGTIAFRDGRFVEARLAFERAVAIHAEPVLLFNIASCWRRSGVPAEAVAAYRRFLDVAPVDDPRRRLATETVATLEAELAATPPPPVAPPVIIPVEVEPRIVIEEDAAEPDPVIAPRPAPAPPRRRSMLRASGLGLSAVGGLLLVAGGVETLRARSLENDVEAFGGDGRRWGRSEADTYQRGQATASRALIFGVSGAVALAGGVTLYVLGRGRERAVAIGGTVGGGGGGLVARGKF